MQVAVLIDGHVLGAVARKFRGRSLSGVQVVDFHAIWGRECDPLNKVRVEHGVLHVSNLYHNLSVSTGDGRNVLFGGGVGGACLELGHGLAAALRHAGALLHNGNQVATFFTTIERYLSHNKLLSVGHFLQVYPKVAFVFLAKTGAAKCAIMEQSFA